MNHGLDFLMTSEHNHMFDGSTGTNASANPTTAKNLYHSGQTMRDSFNAAHPNFLALAGLEWGVISNGGHMNIFNTPLLLEWEYNSSNQLIGDVFVAKGDYAGMYTTMKNNGWIGQFNHPASTGQFNIGGTDLAYTADGDQVMVLCEIMNSSAFSSKTDESQGAGGGYAAACNKLLEAGYHVAFSSDQDNHCANWGASYTNRTGVLIPTGQALNQANFVAALQARHVFATWDKTAQVILTTSGGHVMGDRFNNSGSLTLTANYAPGTGRSISQVQIYGGVPGSNGAVALTSSTAVTTITPTSGNHFYYAKLTQDDGTQLYSAPVWVNQGTGGGDTTPPTVSASESGTSGTITLSASASDNVGVTKVEFYVDATLKATDTSSPYSTTLDSTTLTNGSHSLVAKAYDAAGNVGTSSAASFTVSNSTADTTPPTVSASESGTSGTITLAASASDNVGVTKVEFYVDATLKATDTSSPYSTTLDSTTLTNGSHSLVAKAYDAANNVGTSSTVTFSVSNTTTPVELIGNGGFESGSSGWTASSGVITNDSGEAAHAGTYKAWLDGYGSTTTDTVVQSVAIPSTATSATLTFWLHIDTDETTTSTVYDTLSVQLQNSSGTVLATLATYSNLNAASGYTQKSFNVAAYKGQTVKVYFKGVEDSQLQTSFVIDDVSLKVQ
ncbi:MAG: Ig-like domain-containing protein, partial [Rudaea sp.]